MSSDDDSSESVESYSNDSYSESSRTSNSSESYESDETHSEIGSGSEIFESGHSENTSEDESYIADVMFLSENENNAERVEAPSSSSSIDPHCPVCLEKKLDFALSDCGHLICEFCIPQLEQCPTCRKPIRSRPLRIFL